MHSIIVFLVLLRFAGSGTRSHLNGLDVNFNVALVTMFLAQVVHERVPAEVAFATETASVNAAHVERAWPPSDNL